MMSMIKRILRLLGLVLGAIGMVLCLGVIIGAWWINAPLTNGLLQVFPPIEAALSFGDAAAARFSDVVAETQIQFGEVADAKPLAAALEEEIVQVTRYVNIATALTDAVEEAVSGMAETVQPGVKGIVTARATDRLLTTLQEVTDTLDSAQLLAQEIRDGRAERIDALNAQLETLQSRSTEVQTLLAQIRLDVAGIKRNVPRWVNLGSLLVTLLFTWFGVAQYLLVRSCWQSLRQARLLPAQAAPNQMIDALGAQLAAAQTDLATLKRTINQRDLQ